MLVKKHVVEVTGHIILVIRTLKPIISCMTIEINMNNISNSVKMFLFALWGALVTKNRVSFNTFKSSDTHASTSPLSSWQQFLFYLWQSFPQHNNEGLLTLHSCNGCFASVAEVDPLSAALAWIQMLLGDCYLLYQQTWQLHLHVVFLSGLNLWPSCYCTVLDI